MLDHYVGTYLRNRVAFAALFLFLCFACARPYQQWECEKIQAHYPCSDSAKISWWTVNPCQGIDVHIIFTTCEMFLYFDTHIFEFPFIESNPLKTEVHILADDHGEYGFIADRLEGGQRLVLPAEAGSLLLDLLSAGSSFTISIENYSETILPTHFDHALKRCRYLR
jgi:hypothetical protein